MRKFRKTLSHSSGQIMLIVIAIGSVLIIGLVAVFFVNQTATSHQAASSQNTKTRAVAEEGIGYAAEQLAASSATWRNALGGIFTGTDCNNASGVVSPFGGRFVLHCSVGATGNPNLQPYEVAVTAVALGPVGPTGIATPVRAMQAYLSQRTLGADLSNGVHAGAALQMVSRPDPGVTLDVHWGPIVCLDAGGSWSVTDPLDSGRYPRKFSVGAITGAAWPRSGNVLNPGPETDQKEYWTYKPQFVPLIDETYYIDQARNESAVITAPVSKLSGALKTPISPTCSGANRKCGYFGPPNLLPGDTAIFDGLPYALAGGPVIYVDGSAEFKKVAIDSATFIITGGLTLSDSTSGTVLPLHVPYTASSEYPYPSASCPCLCHEPCTSDLVFTSPFGNSGNVPFRGFLYVKGNVFVAASYWNMVGSLLAGDMQAPPGTSGRINLDAFATSGDSLNVAYDDFINRSIHVNPISGTSMKVVPDLLQDVPAY